MADRNITRRGFFGHTAGAYTAIAMGAGASASLVHDPMLDLIQRYRAAITYFNANAPEDDDASDALADVTYSPLYDQIIDNPPAITTDRGAVEALRAVLSECTGRDPFDQSLLTAALKFFDAKVA